MFQLIVAVISIALVAALAIASIFYGGEAFQKSSEKSAVTALVNQGQQIHAAVQLYQADNGGSISGLDADLSTLTEDGYLATLPSPSNIAKDGTWAYEAAVTGADGHPARVAIDLVDDTACNEIHRQAGGTETNGTVPAPANARFQCVGTGADAVFVYNF